MTRKATILVIGGGFGGVRAARQLAGRSDVEVVLMSDRAEFAYYPQLYHAATGGSRSEASLPLGRLLHREAVRIVQDRAVALHPESKSVTGASGTQYKYDELILALGSITNYFGIPGLQEFAYDIKTIEGATAFKRHLHTQLIGERKPEQHYIVVGAGPTGIELSSALSGYIERLVRLHGVKHPQYSIELVEAAPRILPRSPESYAHKVEKRLSKLGVRVLTDTVVAGQTVDELQLKGKSIKSHTVVWTSGVANNPFFHDNNGFFELAKNGRVVVDDHMLARDHVYVIGDNAFMPFGGLAETAINDANFVARDIKRTLDGAKRPAYRQPKPASVIPVGPGWAAAEYKGMRFYGYVGWLLRRAADLIAYRDVEATPYAIGSWMREIVQEDDCNICLQMHPSA